ncbi:hypothetical protein GEMRC1_004086 [Eukaryota sp. GEM-RC1]
MQPEPMNGSPNQGRYNIIPHPSHGYGGDIPYSYAPSYSRHLEIPVIISGYVRLTFNICCVIGLFCIGVLFVLAIRGDISLRTARSSEGLITEIQNCQKSYEDAKCADGPKSGQAQSFCETMFHCMNMDPNGIETVAISVRAIAEAINSFVEPISYKTMVFIVLLFIIIAAGSNCILGFQRRFGPLPAYPVGSGYPCPPTQHYLGASTPAIRRS